MKYYCAAHIDGVICWKGDIEHDHGQFELYDGEFAIMYMHDLNKIKLDNDRGELASYVLETPDGYSDKYVFESNSFKEMINDFVNRLSSFNKDKYDLIKGILR